MTETIPPPPRSTPAPGPAAWLHLLAAGLLVFLTVAYFENPYWHSHAASQFGLTSSIVERHTLSIDATHDTHPLGTLDKAFFNGHFYSDKSPVNAFLGVPVYAAYRWIRQALGRPFYIHLAYYWTVVWVEGGAAALLAMLMAWALMRRGIAPGRAALAGALWIAATPLLGYSIQFYNYLPACVMIMAGYLLVAGLQDDPPRVTALRLLAAGFLLGLASWTINTCAIAALVITRDVVWLSSASRPGAPPLARSPWRRLALWAVGGALGIAGQFVYSWHIFGSLASPYRYEYIELFRTQMARGLMGATWPRPFVAWLLTFHKFQGLFLFFPLTALALAGALWRYVRSSRTPAGRAPTVESYAALLIFALLLIYTSGYYMWWGGVAYAPRHLIPALPLLGLGMVPWLGRRWPGRLLLAVGLAGAVFNVAAVVITPQPDPEIPYDLLMEPQRVQAWTCPMIKLQKQFWIDGRPENNLGYTVFKLDRRATMLPLAALWAVAAAGLLLIPRRKRPGSVPPAPAASYCLRPAAGSAKLSD